MKKYDVLGIGGPILDLILSVPNEYLDFVPGAKGGMEPVDYPTLTRIIEESGVKPLIVTGGSTRNTLRGLVRFGEKCALLGMIGEDAMGSTYRRLLEEQGIHPLLLASSTPSAQVLSIVTPDGERTMRTFQGASIEIRGEDLKPHFFEGVKLVHLEGYTLFNDNLTASAMEMAQDAGAKVSFDLASFEIVRKFRPQILSLLDNYVDIIFANETECLELTGHPSEEKACDFLAEICEIGVVLMGERGCWVRKGVKKVHCPAYPVRPRDTTGAGDLFASGFLHAYFQGLSLEACGHYGAIAGRAVVQVMGAEVPHEGWQEIYSILKKT